MNWAFEHSFRVVSEDLIRFMEQQGSSIYSLPSADGIVLSIAQSEPGCCIAGGAALAIFTGEMDRIKDWDLFFTSGEAYYHTMRVLEARGFIATERSRFSQTCVKRPATVQLVHRKWYGMVDDIFADFDLSVCCVAISGPDILWARGVDRHIRERKYDFGHTENAAACLRRVARYGQKGFFPSDRFVIDFLGAVESGLPIKDFY
jgi:hypothetical protein